MLKSVPADLHTLENVEVSALLAQSALVGTCVVLA